MSFKDQSIKKKQRAHIPESLKNMITYVDEYGNPTASKPVEKVKVKAEDIVLGIPPKNETEGPEHTGSVKFFNQEKGFGFVVSDQTKKDVFVHINQLERPLMENDMVSFDTEVTPKGVQAINVTILT